MAELTITVNGVLHHFNAPEDTPLLWVLRDNLGLTGTKYSCGEGSCGACTVLLDDDPVRSCQLLISSLQGRDIFTIEGLSEDGSHPLQHAWIEVGVSECGYCQPGQIITALALLKQIPQPSDEDINQAMKGVLCRCGTYNRIRGAIHLAAESTV
jgi:aerobic-type carbon monoxide dehydrogenase small subunit (CoxS/CutS family)